MRDVGRSRIDQLEWFGFKHEAKELLIWFSFKDDGFSIKTIIEEDFIWGKFDEAFVSKDETVVDIADVADEQVMVGKKLVEGNGPDLFTDGNHHQT